MGKIDTQVNGLMEAVQMVSSLDCSIKHCSAKLENACDDYDLAQEAYKKGWRVNSIGNVLCPSHAPKPKNKQ